MGQLTGASRTLLRTVLLAGALLGLGLALPVWLGFAGQPEHDVRTAPRLTQGGRILAAAPPGQLFLCQGAGLERIDLPLTRLGGPVVPLELVLREGGADGPVVRRVTAQPDPEREFQRLSFAFEPIEDASGRWFHFAIAPIGADAAGLSPWVRYHGRVGHNAPWGGSELEARVAGSPFYAPLDELRAIAVACRSLDTSRGPVRLELWEPGADTPLRRAALPEPTVVESGYAFFAFEPVHDSGGRSFAFRVLAEGGLRFNARNGAPSFKTFHGTPGTRPGLGGMTAGPVELPDRDLVFRAWSRWGPGRGLAVVRDRAGWRLWAGMGLWTLAVLALARVAVVGLAATATSGARPGGLP